MPYPPKDGGAIATLSKALALQKSGNDIDILAMNTQKHFCKVEDVPAEFSDFLNFYSVFVNTDIKFVDFLKNLLFSKLPYIAERYISKDYNEKLITILKEKNYDIVQLEGSYLCPYITTIRENSTAKISLHSHNVEFEIWERITKNEKNFVKKFFFNIMTKRLKNFEVSFINKYDFLLPVTERDGLKFNELGNKKKMQILQNGINPERYVIPEAEPEFPGFFTIGSLDWLPNQEGLIWFINNVWLNFIKKYSDAKFYIAGRNAPKKLINFFKNKNIVFLGEIDNANSFISSKSVMLVPLFAGGGMRVKIVEGMVLKKTVISTSIGAEGIDIIHKNNILIADTAKDFYDCLELIYNNKSLHDKISENAKNFVFENLNNYKVAEKLSKFFKENLEND